MRADEYSVLAIPPGMAITFGRCAAQLAASDGSRLNIVTVGVFEATHRAPRPRRDKDVSIRAP